MLYVKMPSLLKVCWPKHVVWRQVKDRQQGWKRAFPTLWRKWIGFTMKDKLNRGEQDLNKHDQENVKAHVVSVDSHGRIRRAHVLPKERPAKNVESQTTLQKCATPNPQQGHSSVAKGWVSTRYKKRQQAVATTATMNTCTLWTTVQMAPKLWVSVKIIVEMIVDTGATTDILDEVMYRNIHEWEHSELQLTTKRLWVRLLTDNSWQIWCHSRLQR